MDTCMLLVVGRQPVTTGEAEWIGLHLLPALDVLDLQSVRLGEV